MDGEVIEGQEQQVETQEQAQEEGQYIPKQQYDKIYGRYQTYHKEFGKPDEIREKLTRLQQYEDAIQKYRSGKSGGEDLTEIKNRLLQVMPELGGIGELAQLREEIANLRQGSIETRMDKASSYLGEKLGKEGIKLTPEEQEDLEDMIIAKMDDEQMQEFISGDMSILDEIVSNLPKTGLYGRLVSAKPTPPKPPTRIGSSGSPAQAQETKPAGMKEALDRGWDALMAAKKG